jgi:hypothetical protein
LRFRRINQEIDQIELHNARAGSLKAGFRIDAGPLRLLASAGGLLRDGRHAGFARHLKSPGLVPDGGRLAGGFEPGQAVISLVDANR